jgi:general secretion pathway protein A
MNSVFNRLPADRVESSVILNPTLTATEFLESVLLDFEIPEVPTSKAQRLWKLHDFLARTHHQNRYAVLVIDEAHKLSHEVLEEIRLLGNFESAADKFLQILLLGQSELDDVLNRQDLRQLKQRIALRLYIDPLSAEEVRDYVRFRWAKAGGREAPPFTQDALTGIMQWSYGIPRIVNSICDSALLMAYGDESPLVGLNYVRAAVTNLAIADGRPFSAVPPPLEGSSIDRRPRKLVSMEVPAYHNITPAVADPAVLTPGLDDDPKANSSLLKRLAERFGLPH